MAASIRGTRCDWPRRPLRPGCARYPLAGCLKPNRSTSCAKRSRSSARSMASGLVPRIGIPASSSACASFSGVCPPNWTITPTQLAVLLFDTQDFQHVFGGQRFEIQPVRRIVIGADGFRIAVDHDGFKPGVGQRETGVATAIVEFDPLPDPGSARRPGSRSCAGPSGRIHLPAGRSRGLPYVEYI